ncbi:MAG: tRNA pseudouridine13 synthase [Paraglaciecola sp.]|jgi:tRNA pseudouridine13 synthase
MEIDHWNYLTTPPSHTGLIKSRPQDFIVREKLGYDLLGEGEHIYLWVRKEQLNTAYLAEEIAKFAKLPLRAVSYAGRKDKHAVTEQWFGVHKPGKAEYDWDKLAVPGATVIKAIRHNKKLRTGVLKGNQFELIIREISSFEGIEERLQAVSKYGVPNYFGPQRFGDSRYDPRGSNLVLAEKMLHGEDIRNRNKRSMAISALRSWLFNEYVSARIEENCYQQPLIGDVMQLAGNASFFNAYIIDPTILQRLNIRDIQISAPMWGAGRLASQATATEFENRVALKHPKVTETLEKLGLKQERRPISLYPQDISWEMNDSELRLRFILPAGAFATSVLREVVNVSQPGTEQ